MSVSNKVKKLTNDNKHLAHGYIRNITSSYEFNIPKMLILLIAIYYQVNDEWIYALGYDLDKDNTKAIRNGHRQGIYSRIYGQQLMNSKLNNNIIYTWLISVNNHSKYDYFIGVIDQELYDQGTFLVNGISHIFNSLCYVTDELSPSESPDDNHSIIATKIQDTIVIKLVYYTHHGYIKIWKNEKLDVDICIKKCDRYTLFASFAYPGSTITIESFQENMF